MARDLVALDVGPESLPGRDRNNQANAAAIEATSTIARTRKAPCDQEKRRGG
jgi:hypothetical protein